ncbi:MAG: 30S ribosomal protein S5 [Verrucomicrobiota bacterium JB024]|nr:30S ribosomal protein S5 [Verrucomicrobiota bacterium JB024]
MSNQPSSNNPQERGRGGQGRGGQGQGRGGPGRGRGPRRERASEPAEELQFVEKVVHINRCAKVVKGGRRFSFAALVVSGDGKGKVGVGYGKAKEVPEAIRKGTERARANQEDISLKGRTIPHEVRGEHDGGLVILRPASEGTGVIAGGGIRAVLEAVGIQDVLSKSLGSNNPGAMVNATLDGLRQLRSAERIAQIKRAGTKREEPAETLA